VFACVSVFHLIGFAVILLSIRVVGPIDFKKTQAGFVAA